MAPEYREGLEAKERFEQTMKTLFQAPKLKNPKKSQRKRTTVRKSKLSDKD